MRLLLYDNPHAHPATTPQPIISNPERFEVVLIEFWWWFERVVSLGVTILQRKKNQQENDSERNCRQLGRGYPPSFSKKYDPTPCWAKGQPPLRQGWQTGSDYPTRRHASHLGDKCGASLHSGHLQLDVIPHLARLYPPPLHLLQCLGVSHADDRSSLLHYTGPLSKILGVGKKDTWPG